MNDKLIIKKPFEIIENNWEKEVEREEETIFNSEEYIYEAEVVEKGNYDLASEIVHQPPLLKETNEPLFCVEIRLNDCYFTKAGTLTSFLWFHDKVQNVCLKKVGEAKKLLKKIENGTVRIVDSWGLETEKSNQLRSELIEGLQSYISDYENGEVVMATFKE